MSLIKLVVFLPHLYISLQPSNLELKLLFVWLQLSIDVSILFT